MIVCYRCKTEVNFSEVLEGYFAYCPYHDEDLFTFETEEVSHN